MDVKIFGGRAAIVRALTMESGGAFRYPESIDTPYCPFCSCKLPMVLESAQPLAGRCRECHAVVFTFQAAALFLQEEGVVRNSKLIEIGMVSAGISCPVCRRTMRMTRPWARYPRPEQYGVVSKSDPSWPEPIRQAGLYECEPCQRFFLTGDTAKLLRLSFAKLKDQQRPALEIEENELGFYNLLMTPDVFGFPIIENVERRESSIAATAMITLVCVAAYAVAKKAGGGFVERWAFYPDRPFLHHGLNFISSVFVHEEPGHLAGNLVFFIPLAWNLEGVIGTLDFLVLFLFCGILGNGFDLLVSKDAIPAIGASGAISGVLTYMILRLPRARMVVRFRNFVIGELGDVLEFKFPLLWYGVFWSILQVYGFYLQSGDGIGYAAHIGGALAGGLYYALFTSNTDRASS